MCLYPKLIRNKKYTETKKNGGNIPPIRDKRVLAIPVGCQYCAECRKQKANNWRVRLFEEIKNTQQKGHFVTLTFSNENLIELSNDIKNAEGYERDNKIATLAVRRFLERWRKKYKKSVRHWLITELGHENTERIHLHGIIWTDKPAKEIRGIWKYGYVWIGYDNQETYVNEKTVNYIIKYVTKLDETHKYYIPKILCSKGIGSKWTKSYNAEVNKYKGEDTKDSYITRQGKPVGLPIYYRNKIYNDEERENLWLHKLDKQVRYVDGLEIDVSTEKGWENYIAIRNATREKYIELGHIGEINYNDEEYEQQRRNLLMEKIHEKAQRAERLVSPSAQTSCSSGALHLGECKTGDIPRSKEFD